LNIKRIGPTAAAVAVAAVMLTASPASAAQACTRLSGTAGGSLPMCKTWNWDGNDYDGKWWTNGPSSLPSYSYLQRHEDGTPYTSQYSGTYNDRTAVNFRVCDRLAGCSPTWW
jgi:hypothetical protein